ncbi:MAG: hypothetical protein RI897_2177 [Verrucomicrobiota bacterium]
MVPLMDPAGESEKSIPGVVLLMVTVMGVAVEAASSPG